MLPQIRMQPWFPGQMGVSGSDVQRGLRWEPQGIVLYVDENHPGASADADGTDPENPLTTIALAIARLTAFATSMATSLEGSVIVVADEATIAESVIIPPTAPKYCTILGAGSTAHHPTWTAATAAGRALTIRQEGWTIEGITFEVGAAGTAIRLEEVTIGSYTAYKTTIRDCRFDGLYGGLYGIDFYGAPHRVSIKNCVFLEFRRGDNTAYGIIVSNTAVGPGSPYQGAVIGCRFQSCENYVGGLGAIVGFNMTLFQNNVFVTSHAALIPVVLYLDLRGGSRGYNIVTGNFFGGVYTNGGGYFANPATPNSCWIGNFAEPTPITVGDNGITIAVP
ncbi:MAG TPA: hypothetical protein VMY40_08610 [Anaerolineae bacterium]|nr:hypothetical protein [Anaerolineae bacterium]